MPILLLSTQSRLEKASSAYAKWSALGNLEHKQYQGGHAITEER